MRTLVVGAGAIGGYFGGRLLEAGRDVTFLVRPRRAVELARDGLRIQSRMGDVTIAAPPAVLPENLKGTFDLVLLALKAYDLEGAMKSCRAGCRPAHRNLAAAERDAASGRARRALREARVLGGACVIAATLNEKHAILHLNESHTLSFGERDGALSTRVEAIASLMAGVRFEARARTTILLDMWEKWVFLATLAGSTCLMRGAVGDIVAAPGGMDFMLGLLEECRAIAAAEGFAPRPVFLESVRRTLTTEGSPLTASMLRDIENRARIEADHVIGDLLRRGHAEEVRAILPIVYAHLKIYEARCETGAPG